MPRPTIKRFDGEYAFLSNFHHAQVQLNGETYPTVEHAFQAAKTLDAHQRTLIRGAANPALAKQRGRAVKLRDDWERIKNEIMEVLVRQKFSLPMLRGKLLETGDALLEEGNTWNDLYWGVDLASGRGANHLGRILMAVRRELQLMEQPL